MNVERKSFTFQPLSVNHSEIPAGNLHRTKMFLDDSEVIYVRMERETSCFVVLSNETKQNKKLFKDVTAWMKKKSEQAARTANSSPKAKAKAPSTV
jgi:hypothetical protein